MFFFGDKCFFFRYVEILLKKKTIYHQKKSFITILKLNFFPIFGHFGIKNVISQYIGEKPQGDIFQGSSDPLNRK